VSALEVEGVSVRFGGHQALSEVALTAEAGAVTGLIGPNGAGKTTAFNVICGLQAPQRGEVRINGKDMTKRRPYQRARAGLARTFQRLELFPLLSVRENVRVAAGLAGARQEDAAALAALRRVGMEDFADHRIAQLSTGQARRVELARALATEPSVLLLDEPASGQTEAETDVFADLLGELAAEGIAVLLVEHDVPLVMRACHHIHVLDFGRIIASGTPDEVRVDAAVTAAYLGTGAMA
jgi:branched-chain amino acid transport system ATP-binding protein